MTIDTKGWHFSSALALREEDKEECQGQVRKEHSTEATRSAGPHGAGHGGKDQDTCDERQPEAEEPGA